MAKLVSDHAAGTSRATVALQQEQQERRQQQLQAKRRRLRERSQRSNWHVLILVAALHYAEARTLDCGPKVGGTGDNTCPRMVEDDPYRQCLSSVLSCSAGLVYHCLRNEQGEWTEVCAKEEMCDEGKEPMVTDSGNIVCRYCYDPERYNPERETLSNKLSECPNKKTVCKKEKNDRIECEEPYDKNDPYSKYKMDRLCRCSYEEDMVPTSYVFGRDFWTCSYPEVMKCSRRLCPMTKDGMKQTRGRDYMCYPVEAVSPVTSTSSSASKKSEITSRATGEDSNQNTPRIFVSTTEIHTFLPPSITITEDSDVPNDDLVSHILRIVLVVLVVAVILVAVGLFAVYIYKNKTKKYVKDTAPQTVINKTKNYPRIMINTTEGNPTFNLLGQDSSGTESQETTPQRPRRHRYYKRAEFDRTTNLDNAHAPLAAGEETDESNETEIKPQPGNKAYSSLKADIHAPPSEISPQVESKCKECGKGSADVMSAENMTEQDTKTSPDLGEKYKRVLAKMTTRLKENMDPESVLDCLNTHDIVRPNNYMNISNETKDYKKNGMIIELIKGPDNYKTFKMVLKETKHEELLTQILKTEAIVISEDSGEISEESNEDEDHVAAAQLSTETDEKSSGNLSSETDNNDNHLGGSGNLNADDQEHNKDTNAKRWLDTLIGEPWEELVEQAEEIENDFLGNNLKIPVKTATCLKHAQTCQKRVSSLPQELEAFESSPNGDCLYNSVSKVLYGDERAANRLRLAAVVDGVKNCKKYIKQHITDRNNVPDMTQFMHSVLTDESINKLDSSRSEDLEYLGQFLIHNAVLETIKPGSYSSSIQVLFLSNAIGYRIRQYYEDEIRPKDDALPLFGVENVEECIILLWVKGDGSPTLNHIVPVLPKAKLVTTSVN